MSIIKALDVLFEGYGRSNRNGSSDFSDSRGGKSERRNTALYGRSPRGDGGRTSGCGSENHRNVKEQFSLCEPEARARDCAGKIKENRPRSMRPGFRGPVTGSAVSISDILQSVNLRTRKNREPLRLPVPALVRKICHQLLRRERAEGLRVLRRPAHGGVHIADGHTMCPGDGLERAARQLLRGRSGHLLLPFLRPAVSMSRRRLPIRSPAERARQRRERRAQRHAHCRRQQRR